MRPKMTVIIIIAIVVLVLGTGVLWYRNGIHQAEDNFLYADKNSGTPKASFHCQPIPEITFDYPLFKNLDKPYVISSENSCSILLNNIPNDKPNGAVIEVTKIQQQAFVMYKPFPKNNYGVMYQELSGVDGYLFFSSDVNYAYRVTFSNYSNAPIDHDLLWKTIIDSFREITS